MKRAPLNLVSQSLQARSNILFNFPQKTDPFTIAKRFLPEPVKRFYAEPVVTQVGDHYELSLDKRPLKTPKQKPFRVQCEGLANMIATEWSAQRKIIAQSTMHLTALANTTQDNPLHKSKEDLANEILTVLPEDTILYYTVENEKLLKLQMKKWKPIVEWFETEFQLKIPLVVNAILPPVISAESKEKFRNYLTSLNKEAVQGLTYGIGAVHSVILTMAATKGVLSVDEAIRLSRLETLFQIDHWGNVEWSHDIDLHDSVARLSASILYFQAHHKV